MKTIYKLMVILAIAALFSPPRQAAARVMAASDASSQERTFVSDDAQDREQEKRDREQELRDREQEKRDREQELKDRAQEKLDRQQELYDRGQEALERADWKK